MYFHHSLVQYTVSVVETVPLFAIILLPGIGITRDPQQQQPNKRSNVQPIPGTVIDYYRFVIYLSLGKFLIDLFCDLVHTSNDPSVRGFTFRVKVSGYFEAWSNLLLTLV